MPKQIIIFCKINKYYVVQNRFNCINDDQGSLVLLLLLLIVTMTILNISDNVFNIVHIYFEDYFCVKVISLSYYIVIFQRVLSKKERRML